MLGMPNGSGLFTPGARNVSRRPAAMPPYQLRQRTLGERDG